MLLYFRSLKKWEMVRILLRRFYSTILSKVTFSRLTQYRNYCPAKGFTRAPRLLRLRRQSTRDRRGRHRRFGLPVRRKSQSKDRTNNFQREIILAQRMPPRRAPKPFRSGRGCIEGGRECSDGPSASWAAR